jgi:hypothetical protein
MNEVLGGHEERLFKTKNLITFANRLKLERRLKGAPPKPSHRNFSGTPIKLLKPIPDTPNQDPVLGMPKGSLNP